MSLEHNLWQSLKSRLDSEAVFYQRIETITSNGVPDLWIAVSDAYCWIELKSIGAYPKKGTTPVFGEKHGLRIEQKVWHQLAHKFNVRSAILASVGSGHSREVFFIPNDHAKRFNTLNKLELAAFKLPTGLAGVARAALGACGAPWAA